MISDGCVARCPACAHRDLPYEDSLKQKQEFLASQVQRFQRLDEIRARPESARGYRKSVFLHTKRHEGEWVAGVLRKVYRDEELIPIPDCPIQRPELNARVRKCLALLKYEAALPLFGLLIRDALVTLVLKARRSEDLLSRLEELPWVNVGAFGVFVNFHESAGSRITHPKGWSLLWGVAEAPLTMQSGRFFHGPSAFLQQLPELHEESIDLAEEFFSKEPGPEGVLDLYCGIGVSLARWSARGYRTLGVDVGEDAVRSARRNGEVLVGRVEQRLPQLREWGLGMKRIAVYANPSRLGLEPAVSAWLAEEKRITRMAYLSCSPGTLARDLEVLVVGGFRVERIVPFDFLPGTAAVESLALLSR